ncbi:hypothetical protein GCM10010531_19490 [Blastococcus jejuensis]|uniref:Uncharacterized protein n=1 Tax=Blastococcus jejuensis TaxID=351224 RepID=A0ABP6P4F7_9ACTN
MSRRELTLDANVLLMTEPLVDDGDTPWAATLATGGPRCHGLWASSGGDPVGRGALLAVR